MLTQETAKRVGGAVVRAALLSAIAATVWGDWVFAQRIWAKREAIHELQQSKAYDVKHSSAADDGMYRVIADASYGISPKAVRLLLYASDDCATCDAAYLPWWDALAATGDRHRLASDLEIWLVKKAGDQLPSPLEDRVSSEAARWQLPYKVMLPINERVFEARTGVAYAPTALAVDRDGNVFCGFVGVASADEVRGCMDRAARRSSEPVEALIGVDSRVQPFW